MPILKMFLIRIDSVAASQSPSPFLSSHKIMDFARISLKYVLANDL